MGLFLFFLCFLKFLIFPFDALGRLICGLRLRGFLFDPLCLFLNFLIYSFDALGRLICRLRLRGFLYPLSLFLNFLIYSFDALGRLICRLRLRGFLYPLSLFLNFLIFPFDALRPRRAPTFWPAESRQRLAKEGCAPFGIPPCGRARVACGHNRARGVTELLAASRQELPGDLRRLRRKSRNERGTMRCAHDRQTFPFGERGGQGGEAPTPKRWRCGNRGERARARGLPQRHRSSSREAARSSAKFTAPARTWGFPKGGVQHPTLVRGFARG